MARNSQVEAGEMLAEFGWLAHDTFDKFKWNQAAIEHQAA
jgi:hypothetical protein